ncbi:hypothetical protein NW760_010909 [Fusarium oxysporum]|nr:hypothetical protein NW769_009925 [Fusarium oxysporum]KAJ4223225.1 hypothetical protein NW760_010909 [Fusarium oxysporum]
MDEKRDLGPLDCNWETDGPGNRSAYLWQAGLWTACQETHAVVSRHSEKVVGPLVKEWKPISIPAEDIQSQIRNQKIRKLAVKFDPVWNDELTQATHGTRVARFSAPLAFMLRVLLDASHQHTYMRKLMVIDDISQWKPLMPRGNLVRAFDCDHEYIEVSPISLWWQGGPRFEQPHEYLCGSSQSPVRGQATKDLQYGYANQPSAIMQHVRMHWHRCIG